MDNMAWGICVALLCTGGYILAFYKHQRNGQHAAVLLLMLCGLLLRTYSSADAYLHEWDERYHALVARHLMGHPLVPTLYDKPLLPYSFNEWTFNYIWLHKQPLPLWLMALSLKIFGVHAWAVRVPSVIMSVLGIQLVYDIGSTLYDRRSAFVAAFLFSVNGFIIELAAGRHATEHIDVAFMFFVLLAVWCAVRQADTGKYVFAVGCGLAIGAAILCKWLPALIVLPVWLVLAWKKQGLKPIATNLLIMLGVAAMVALPWQIYIFSHFHREAAYELSYNSRHMFEVLSNQQGNFFFHFDSLRIEYGDLVYLPVLWLTYRGIRYGKAGDVAMLIWFWGVYLFFSVCATKMSAYTLFACPAVFLITGATFSALKDGSVPLPRRLALVLAGGLLLLPVRYTVERVKPFSQPPRDLAWNKVIERFAQGPDNNARTVVLNCDHSIEMMFATDCICYDHDVADTCAARLTREGYKLLVMKGDVFVGR